MNAPLSRASTDASEREAHGKLRWLCRRGMKELDVLLADFLDARYEALDAERQQAFRELLEMEDPDLHACLLGAQSASTPALNDVIERLRQHRR